MSSFTALTFSRGRWHQNPCSGSRPSVLGSLTLSRNLKSRARHMGLQDLDVGLKAFYGAPNRHPADMPCLSYQPFFRNIIRATLSLELKLPWQWLPPFWSHHPGISVVGGSYRCNGLERDWGEVGHYLGVNLENS